MTELETLAPDPAGVALRVGTTVVLDDDVEFLDDEYVCGGAPWRLLRLTGGARRAAERWRHGDVVRAGEERLARTLVGQGLVHPIFRTPLEADEVEVVIPVRDDPASLRRLLTSLRGLHVTVVDDASINPVLIEECARQFDARLLRLDVNVGPAGARNAGARSTPRAYVLFVDVDVTIDDVPSVLERLRAPFEDPQVAACAPRIRGGVGGSLRDRFELRFSPLDMGDHGGIVVPGGPIGYVPSACLLVRRDALGSGFDEELRTGEDVDFVWRLHDRGWLVRYVADVIVTHSARGSWRAWWRQRVAYGASSGDLAKRHGERMAPVRSDIWTILAWTSMLAGRPALAFRILRVTRDSLRTRISTPGGPDSTDVADKIVRKAVLGTGAPLARAVVRTFGAELLALALVPRLRRPAMFVFAIGTAWRWRHQRPHLADIPLAIADDAAYGVGVMKGAWSTRSFAPLTPRINKSSVRLRDVLGLAPHVTLPPSGSRSE